MLVALRRLFTNGNDCVDTIAAESINTTEHQIAVILHKTNKMLQKQTKLFIWHSYKHAGQ